MKILTSKVNVAIDDETLKKLKDICGSVPVSVIVRNMIRKYVKSKI